MHGSCSDHNVIGEVVFNTGLWYTEDGALILLCTEKACFELDREGISLETTGRALQIE